jgi:hypothetical protein
MFDKLKDLGGLMQQAQQMQQKMQELQAALERLEIVGSSGAGLVKVTVNGKNETRRDRDRRLAVQGRGQGRRRGPDRGGRQRRAGQGRADRAGADARHHRRPPTASGLQALGTYRQRMNGPEIERLIQLLGRLPGLGPRSARRVALHLLKKRETLDAAAGHGAGRRGARHSRLHGICGNLDTIDPCSICADSPPRLPA